MFLFLQKHLANLFYCIYIVKKDVLIRFSKSHGTAGVIYLYLGPLVRLSPRDRFLLHHRMKTTCWLFFYDLSVFFVPRFRFSYVIFTAEFSPDPSQLAAMGRWLAWGAWPLIRRRGRLEFVIPSRGHIRGVNSNPPPPLPAKKLQRNNFLTHIKLKNKKLSSQC